LLRFEQTKTREVLAKIDQVMTGIQQMTLDRPTGIDEISTKLNALSSSMSELQQDLKTTKSNQDVLKTLRFARFDFRYNRVTQAHGGTLHWVFTDSILGLHGPVRVHFREWLEGRDGIFWLRGKAGSGKSTLMKFLCDYPKTLESLKVSAKSQRHDKIAIGKYFFWNPGSPLQKSQEGLLRSLVFDILRWCPESIPEVGAKLRQRRSEISEGEEELWNWDLLWETLGRVISQNTSTTFCFFIDGLDEFSGDSEHLIDTVKRLTSHSNVKICVSSRPWAEFVHEFGDDDTRLLKLEDLNAQDIKNYVHEALSANSRFQRLAAKDDSALKLKEEVATKSDGVFLWVYLVVRSLLEGIRYADSTQFLWKRLRAFPPDLDGFFTHMLKGIPKIYHCKTASTFKLAMTATSSLAAMVYYFVDCIEEDGNFALSCKRGAMPISEAKQIIHDMALRLDGWTKGLLEVVHHSRGGPDYTQSKVEFLHRTARDFIAESAHVDEMFAKVLDPEFDVSGLLCRGLLAFRKQSGQCEDRNIELAIFYHASNVSNILWRMANVNPILDEVAIGFYGSSWETRPTSVADMCKYAAEYGLVEYIDEKLLGVVGRQSRTPDFYSTLLTLAVASSRRLPEHEISSESQLATVRYLVNMGGSLGEKNAAWEKLLHSLRPKVSGDENVFKILCALVSAGVDLDAPFGASVFREEVKAMLPQVKAAELLALEPK
jgi:hypothetical protein